MSNMEAKQIDAEGMKFLERITPISGIEDQLIDIINNNNFIGNPTPGLSFVPLISDGIPRIPYIDMKVIDSKSSFSETIYKISVNLWNCDDYQDGRSAIECMSDSRFRELFNNRDLDWYEAVFMADVKTAARLLTYYVSLYERPESSYSHPFVEMSFTSGNMSKVNIPDEISVPNTFFRAVSKLKELRFSYDAGIFLSLSGLNDRGLNNSVLLLVFDYKDETIMFEYRYFWDYLNELERLREYKNFDCMETNTFEVVVRMDDSNLEKTLLFFTDYFLFQNPNISVDNIVVSIDFSSCSYPNSLEKNGNDNMSDWLFSFYPDGSEDSQEKLTFLLDAFKKARRYYRNVANQSKL